MPFVRCGSRSQALVDLGGLQALLTYTYRVLAVLSFGQDGHGVGATVAYRAVPAAEDVGLDQITVMIFFVFTVIAPSMGGCRRAQWRTWRCHNQRGVGGSGEWRNERRQSARPTSGSRLSHRSRRENRLRPTEDRGQGKEDPAVAICAILRAPRY